MKRQLIAYKEPGSIEILTMYIEGYIDSQGRKRLPTQARIEEVMQSIDCWDYKIIYC